MIDTIWVYLSASPLLWLTATLGAYGIGEAVARSAGRNPAANPVLIAVVLLVALLRATGTSFDRYFDGAQFVHFLLGPATVALAVPLVREMERVRRALLPILAGLFAGSITAIVSVVAIAWALGASSETLLSLAPKSATAPIAMAASERIGGIATLTAVLGVLTGIVGAIAVTPLLNAAGVRDNAARGFAAGVAASGIGTARAFQLSELAGTFAGLGLALNGVATAALAPLLAPALVRWLGH